MRARASARAGWRGCVAAGGSARGSGTRVWPNVQRAARGGGERGRGEGTAPPRALQLHGGGPRRAAGQGYGRARAPPHSTCYSHPKQASRREGEKYTMPATGPGEGVRGQGRGRLEPGMEKRSKRDGTGRLGGAARLGRLSSAKVTSESHSLWMPGQRGPSSVSVPQDSLSPSLLKTP